MWVKPYTPDWLEDPVQGWLVRFLLRGLAPVCNTAAVQEDVSHRPKSHFVSAEISVIEP